MKSIINKRSVTTHKQRAPFILFQTPWYKRFFRMSMAGGNKSTKKFKSLAKGNKDVILVEDHLTSSKRLDMIMQLVNRKNKIYFGKFLCHRS